MKGDTYGVGGWATWQVSPWWRLSPGFTALREQLRFKTGSAGLLGIASAGDDPSTHATLASSMQFDRLTLDATLRYVGALPNPVLSHYMDLTGRIGWRLSHTLDLSLNGLNLLHASHYEFAPSQGGERIYRSVAAEVRWQF
jgi:iron complex outermembrane receptor protein